MAWLGGGSCFDGDILETLGKENHQMTYGEWHKRMMEQIQMDNLLELLEKQNQLIGEINGDVLVEQEEKQETKEGEAHAHPIRYVKL